MARYINLDSALQAHPEFLNEQIDDHDKAIYAKGWNACNSAFYGAIKELPTVSPDEVRGVGKWEKDSDGLDVCSECGEVALQRVFIKLPDKIVDLQMVRSKFCPNCGAKMEVTSDA